VRKLDDFDSFTAALSHCILGTDMLHHFSHVSKLQNIAKDPEYFNVNNVASRSELMPLIVHCADLGGQTQCLAVARKWGERCMEEFSKQSVREIELKLPKLTMFMKDLDVCENRRLLQLGFIRDIVKPLWIGLTSCFPSLVFALDNLILNETWYCDANSN
jgi:hypothetical protein